MDTIIYLLMSVRRALQVHKICVPAGFSAGLPLNIRRFQNFRRPEIDDLLRGLKAIWFNLNDLDETKDA